MTASRRRWSFSLRTLFVVLTLLAIGPGWAAQQVRTVAARKAVWSSMPASVEWFKLGTSRAHYAICGRFDHDGGDLPQESRDRIDAERQRIVASVPWFRRMLGDHPVAFIACPAHDIPRIERLFPEAEVIDEVELLRSAAAQAKRQSPVAQRAFPCPIAIQRSPATRPLGA
jgi:hypothetical protein